MKDSKLVTWLGVVVAVAAVFAAPEFANVIGDKASHAFAMLGAVVAAVGRALGETD